MGPPVVVVTSNGRPVINVTSNAPPAVVVTSNGEPVVVVTSNGEPMVLGQPSEPLASGQRYFVTAFDRATTARKCAEIRAEFGLIPIPTHACTYKRPGDTIPTIIISLDDMGLVHKHEVYHVRQLDRGEPADHKGWK